MSYGIEALNTLNRIQITQDFKNARLVASGYVSGGYTAPNGSVGSVLQYSLPYDGKLEPPIVLIKPTLVDRYVGGMVLVYSPTYPNGRLFLYGQCPFNYAIFSTLGTPIADTGNFGLEVYKEDGTTLAYSSKHSHPRIKQLIYKPGMSIHSYPFTSAITPQAQIPWMLANSCTGLPSSSGGPDEVGVSGMVMVSINSALNTLSFDLRDHADADNYYGSLPYQAMPYKNETELADPYYGNRVCYFGVADYA